MIIHLLVPGDLETQTGGYVYDRQIVSGLRQLGWQVHVHRLDSSFPRPAATAVEHARRVFCEIPDGAIVVVDGLALAGLAECLKAQGQRLRVVALIHHPAAMESGLDENTARVLHRAEEASLTFTRGVIVTSSWTSRELAGYGVMPERVRVVRPGVSASSTRPARACGDATLRLLCVATLTRRKGHAVLFNALATLVDRPWRLQCAGSFDRDPAIARALREQIENLGLGSRVTFLGEIEQTALDRCYADSDVFVLASHMEGYGMVLADALAYGLPVVSTSAGAIPETVPANAGLLVPPNDEKALSAALGKIMDDPHTRTRLAAGAIAARSTFPAWDQASAQFADALKALTDAGHE